MDFDATYPMPTLSTAELRAGLEQAALSTRRRFPKILHEKGADLNRVVNFIMRDSYMQPHHHPSPEKIEKIYLMEGCLAVLFFDDAGLVTKVTVLEPGRLEFIAVPAFTWHTYVMLTEHAVTYETMMGEYSPKTWKEFAHWAPSENEPGSSAYLESLRSTVNT
jgi:cupin fold WbuC family metalloprotein